MKGKEKLVRGTGPAAEELSFMQQTSQEVMTDHNLLKRQITVLSSTHVHDSKPCFKGQSFQGPCKSCHA